jgi:hypothetical protein
LAGSAHVVQKREDLRRRTATVKDALVKYTTVKERRADCMRNRQ